MQIIYLYFSIELFNALYRRVLCRNRLNDDQLTVTSLQALAKVYKRYYEEIGYFSDMPYILQMLDRVRKKQSFILKKKSEMIDTFSICSVFLQRSGTH